jgi:probable dihydroxyacetone kinase regulator
LIISDNTKNMLSEAFERLMSKKSFDKITVNDITASCGVSRQTFYRHFKDKYDLLNWTYLELFNKTITHIGENSTWDEAALKILYGILQKSTFYSNALRSKDINSLGSFAFNTFMDFYERLIKINNPMLLDNDTLFLLEMYCRGSCEMCIRWAIGGMKESPKSLVALFKDGMPPRISEYLIREE